MAILTPAFWMKIIEHGIRVLEKQGLATVLVLAISYFGFTELAIPLRDGHLRLLDRLGTSSEQSAHGVNELADGVHKLSREVGEARSSLDGIDSKLSKALEAIGKQ